MLAPVEFSFQRYLAAKKSVDDRALNKGVWETLFGEVRRRPQESPLRILEIGAGIGTMFERTLEWGLLAQANYKAIDSQAENIITAMQRFPSWAVERNYAWEGAPGNTGLIHQGGLQVEVQVECIALADFIAREKGRRQWDLLVAHAFLDLVDVPQTLPHLFDLSAGDGLFYFTLNFDGKTILEPAIDPDFDNMVESLYHRTMDERLIDGVPSGDSRTGRHLFQYLRQAGAVILDAGASDWVVYPGRAGYPHDEAYFLHFIVHTIHQALAGHPDLDAARFEDWIVTRHAQIEAKELVYIAHQLDFMGRSRNAFGK